MTTRSSLLLEMDGLLDQAKSRRCFPETIELLEQAIAAQEIAEGYPAREWAEYFGGDMPPCPTQPPR